MNATPFFSAQGGGSFVWHCISQTTGFDYSDQLASIQGLTRSAGFAGEIKTPEVTITIAGYGLYAGDGVGSELVLSLTETSSGNSVDFGCYIVKNIETTGTIFTIKASGKTGDTVPEDYNAYFVPARDPRQAAQEWLYEATGDEGKQVTYTDSYQRDQARVAAPAATLKVNGFVEGQYSIHVRGDNKTDYPSTSWSPVTTAPPILDAQRDLAPEFANKRAFLGNTPLWWHQRNQTWQVTISARATNPATTTDKCQFPLGLYQDIFYTMTLQNGVVNTPTLYFSQERELLPGDTREVTLEFNTAKETADYAAKMRKKTSGDVEIKMSLGQKKVIISNVATYSAVKMPWYDAAKAAIASTAATITAPINDSVELSKVTIRSNSSAVVTFASNAGLSINNIQFKGARLDSIWINYGINSASNLKSTYQMQQWGLLPITIDQRYFTRALMAQAATLGSMGFFEGYGKARYGVQTCDLCPETGTVYGLPVTSSTVAEVAQGSSYPMPGCISCTFADVKGDEHTYNWTNSDGDPSVSANFGIVQGHTQGWQNPVNNRFSISSSDWGGNPGGLCDRWSGAYLNSNNQVAYTQITSGNAAFKLLTEGGDLIQCGYYYNISGTYNYTVRDADGAQHSVFLTSGQIAVSGTVPQAQSNVSPYLDFFPILQWLQANKRVFADNLTRQAFNLKTTLAFASATPGDVLAVQLDKIFEGSPALALVLGVEVSTDGYCNLEIVPMHKITSSDYNNFTNLSGVLS